MTTFKDEEVSYLRTVDALGRLATVDSSGQPRIVPLGWTYNHLLETIDLTGRNAEEFAASRKFRDVQANPKVAFVVDDVVPPWSPRAVIVHGTAVVIQEPATNDHPQVAMIRIFPETIISWGLDP